MQTDVVIVGGGPVGLFLAASLLQNGVRVRVLEQRGARGPHSRAIGIHPPALAALDGIGLATAMVHEGVPIRSGIAVSGGNTVGSMSFSSVSDTFPFVLALPQSRTQKILEERVRALDRDALVTGARVTGIKDDDGGPASIAVEPSGGGCGSPGSFSSALVVAADGARSQVRSSLAVPVDSRKYPDHYLMGDYADDGRYGTKAVLFLAPAGIVESFPLPGGIRRWVVRLGRPASGAGPEELAALVWRRTGVLPDATTSTMLSAFSVRSALARRTVTGRVFLVGDAAHEISPIGGQGMNLGWLDARALAPVIVSALAGKPIDGLVEEYEATRRRAALLARRQSEINMLLGRPLPPPMLKLRNLCIGTAAAVPPVNRWVARRFTMQ